MRETVRGEQVARSATCATPRLRRKRASLICSPTICIFCSSFRGSFVPIVLLVILSTYHIICKDSIFSSFYDRLCNFSIAGARGQVPRGWRGCGGGGDKRKDDRSFLPSFMWCHQESNRGHKDFQSFALPTELWHLALDCECKVIAFCRIYQILSQLFFKKINNCDKMVVRDGRGGYQGRTFGTHSLIYPQSRHPACRHVPAWRSPTSLARWLHGYAPPPGVPQQ